MYLKLETVMREMQVATENFPNGLERNRKWLSVQRSSGDVNRALSLDDAMGTTHADL
jgi:hypothetical protein